MALSDAERMREYRRRRNGERNAEEAAVTEERNEPLRKSGTPEGVALRNGISLAVEANVTPVTKNVTDEEAEWLRQWRWPKGVTPPARICPACPGLTFPDLVSHAEHLRRHNPSPAQWAGAYDKIRAMKGMGRWDG
jgi:hypothetical protein